MQLNVDQWKFNKHYVITCLISLETGYRLYAVQRDMHKQPLSKCFRRIIEYCVNTNLGQIQSTNNVNNFVKDQSKIQHHSVTVKKQY